MHRQGHTITENFRPLQGWGEMTENGEAACPGKEEDLRRSNPHPLSQLVYGFAREMAWG